MTPHTWAWFNRRLRAFAALVMFLVFAGATYQGVATALERRRLPHPGRLIDVGGHQLHLDCTGEGTPVVVLEAPALGMSRAWGWVQTRVSERTRVCSYDRAGLGWSEAGDAGYDPARKIEELHILLMRAKEPGPYVMVGHGLGAVLARSYARQYRAEITALLLIDEPAPGEGPEHSPVARLARVLPWLARTGILRATAMLTPHAEGLPAASADALAAFLYRPDHLTRGAAELERWSDTVALAEAAPIDEALTVARVETTGASRPAFLNDVQHADAVSAAIERLLQVASGKSEGTSDK